MGRLRVVDAPKFSALPHAVLFDRRLSHAARLLYAVLQAHWWQSGVCYASHATLAEEMGVSTRMLRTYLDALIGAGLIVESPHGERRAKSYAPAPIGSTLPIATVESEAGFSLPPSNRKPVSEQSEARFRLNEKPASDSYKKTPEKKTPEEDEGDAPRPAGPAPTPSGRLIDLVRAGGATVTMRPQDHKALKDSGADPSLVAEAYCAIYHGRWGDDFCRRNLSVQFVIGRLAGYQATKANGPAARKAPPGVTNPTLGSNGTRRQVKVRTFE